MKNKKFKTKTFQMTIILLALSLPIISALGTSGYERKTDSYYEVYVEYPVYMPISSGTGGVEETPIKFYVYMYHKSGGFLGLGRRGPDWYKISVYADADAFGSYKARQLWGMKRFYPTVSTEFGHQVTYTVSVSVSGEKGGASIGANIEDKGSVDWDCLDPNDFYYKNGDYRSSVNFRNRYWAPLGWLKNDFSNGIFIWDYPTRYSSGSCEIATSRDYFDYMMGKGDKDVYIWVHVDMHWMSNGYWSPTDKSYDFIIGDHIPSGTDVKLQWDEGSCTSSFS